MAKLTACYLVSRVVTEGYDRFGERRRTEYLHNGGAWGRDAVKALGFTCDGADLVARAVGGRWVGSCGGSRGDTYREEGAIITAAIAPAMLARWGK